MSMTQIAFLEKSRLPSRKDLETAISRLGYSFVFLEPFDKFEDLHDFACKIKGNETVVEMHHESAAEVLEDYPAFRDKVGAANHAISFHWGSDIAAAAAIAVLSLALIDISNATIIYADDKMQYTREMLVADIPAYLLQL